MRMAMSVAAALIFLFGIEAAAAQQPRQIEFKAGKPFRHKHSKLQLPTAIDSLPLVRITELEGDQLDVFANYEVAGQNELISVYIYRRVTAAVPVWFDRARWAIENRSDVYGTPTLVSQDLAFRPPGQSGASGLAAVYALNVGKYRSTGVALASMGEWLVKVRYSSATRKPEELDQRIKGVFAALQWPKVIPPAPVATPVIPCPAPLALAGRSAPAPHNGPAMLLGALMGAVPAEQNKDEAPIAEPIWCRDPAPLSIGAVYRAAGETDGYLIALSDAGRGVRVQPSVADALIAADKDKQNQRKPSWSVELLQLHSIVSFAAQDRLPPPEQALEIIEEGKYVTATSTWGKKTNVEVNPDMMQ